MTDHLTDDVLAHPSGEGPDEKRRLRHLETCAACRGRSAVWQDIRSALRTESAEQALAVPSFDALLGPALAGPAERAPRADAVPVRRRTALPWRTAGQLVLRQALLMPRSWAPLSAAGFVGAAVLAAADAQDRFGTRLFGAVVVLLVVFGALMVASPRRDPRRELLFTLPVSPAVVFLSRLTVVLGVDVALAMGCSALVAGPGWWPVVSSWLGESLLAASLTLALSVRFSTAAGASAGAGLWLLGLVGGPLAGVTTPFAGFLDALLATTPWSLALAAALLGWAAATMRSFGDGSASRPA
ncbi:hypothetical protein ACIGJO_07295 [Streptomyces sp. NPDC079020]|uniref:hypothetical protein n=1 Tax=Streptomyces sp. NPDC079020 TaxID=3365722 RepID=UPI0037D8B373